VEFNLIGEDDLQFIVHPLHPWADQTQGAAGRHSQSQTHHARARRQHVCADRILLSREGIQIHPFIEIANEQAIMEFVRLDMGVGILPRWLVAEDIAQRLTRGVAARPPPAETPLGRAVSEVTQTELADNLFFNVARGVFRKLAQTERREFFG
jgi:DNA-binding transcriptional LysR family regulator